MSKNIPVMVLNSMNPDGQGTVILQSAFIEDGVRSVSSKENIRLVRVSQPVMTAVSELGFFDLGFALMILSTSSSVMTESSSKSSSGKA